MNMDFIFISRKDKSIRDMQTEFRTETAAKILIQELQVFATCCRPDVNTKLAKKKKKPSRMLKTSFYLFMFLKQTRFGDCSEVSFGLVFNFAFCCCISVLIRIGVFVLVCGLYC